MILDDGFDQVAVPKLHALKIESRNNDGIYRVKLFPVGRLPFFLTKQQADNVCDLYSACSERPFMLHHCLAIKNQLAVEFTEENFDKFSWHYEVKREAEGFIILVSFGSFRTMEFAGLTNDEVPMKCSD